MYSINYAWSEHADIVFLNTRQTYKLPGYYNVRSYNLLATRID